MRAINPHAASADDLAQALPIDLAHNVSIPTDDARALKRAFETLSLDPEGSSRC